MSDVAAAIDHLKNAVGLYHEQRVANLLDAQRAALSAPLETDDLPHCYCPGECEMDEVDMVCPVVKRVWADLLPVLLKRIGAEVKP